MADRVLIADDEEASRKGLKALLTNWGYEVQEAADGQEALERAATFLPRVVVTDVLMPRLDGLGLLAQLRVDSPLTTVILLTGHATVETAVAAMKQGAYDYLTKPVDLARLRILIEKALEKGEALREVTLLRRQLQAVWGSGRLVGEEPGHAGALPDDRSGGSDLRAGAHLGGERNGQGAGGAQPPRACLPGTKARSWRSIARLFPRPCWRARSSATRRGRSRVRWSADWAALSWPTVARSSWTRSRR